jgi:HD superfamily phosphohydrolase
MPKIYDSVHGFIRFNDLEKKLIDSLAFQRLHYLHQLGIAYLVYPGATHTRFEHSLGVMELVSRIFDRVADKHAIPDRDYWRQVLRLSALCHDLGHLPFSHVAEKALLGKGGHEKWTLEIIESPLLKPLWQEVRLEDVLKMSVGEKKLKELKPSTPSFSSWEKVLAQTISGDFFGADRIDYLLRDAQCTGVAYGLIDYHQLIEMLCILPVNDQLELGIEENGIESCEALLLARHFMHKRVYQYASVKAYSFHMSRFMTKLPVPKTTDEYLAYNESHVLCELSLAYQKGDTDAAALLMREKRFKALPLPDTLTADKLTALQKKLSIPDDRIGWELAISKKAPLGLSFPVLKRNQTITDASLCSDIVIPIGSLSWVYLSPEYEKEWENAIQVL